MILKYVPGKVSATLKYKGYFHDARVFKAVSFIGEFCCAVTKVFQMIVSALVKEYGC